MMRLMIMRRINRFQIFFVWFLITGSGICGAQSSGRLFITEEIQNLENALKSPDISVIKRQDILIRQARLFQLAGNFEEAARLWNDAAAADPEKQNDTSLLEGAFCFFALGELGKSETAAKTVSLTSRDNTILYRAKYLLAQIEAFRSADLSLLIELISDANYDRYRPAIYYTLWKVSGTDRYKSRLLSEYPRSPEALIVKEPASGKAGIFPSALWLLFPGRDKLTLETAEEIPAPSSGSRQPAALQTGLFGKEENAESMANRLKSAGFEAVINQRSANDGGAYWVVTVPSGSDINQTIAQLKDKGFDSFPVF